MSVALMKLEKTAHQKWVEMVLSHMADAGEATAPHLEIDVRLDKVDEIAANGFIELAETPESYARRPGKTPKFFDMTERGEKMLQYIQTGNLFDMEYWKQDILACALYMMTGEARHYAPFLMWYIGQGGTLPDEARTIFCGLGNAYVWLALTCDHNADWSFVDPAADWHKGDKYRIGGSLSPVASAALETLEPIFADKDLSGGAHTPAGAAFTIIETALIHMAATFVPDDDECDG